MGDIPIAIAKGDGIGPEIMEATLHVLSEAGANLDIHEVVIGEKAYLAGHKTGIDKKAWELIKETKAFLKAPITTPQGGGFKSLNVTVRTTLGLFANVRPCVAFHPFVSTKHPSMDVVIIRENEEDLYAGIEYQQTPNVATSIKIISRSGSEKIIRYAFEYARHHGRKKVTCFTKDNIMKLSDGLFHEVFKEISLEYPDIENEHWIVDIGAAKLADTPEVFDVIVLPNLYGDILSDVAAQISGSVGLAGSGNIGEHGAMFEAIHGSAPRRAGQNKANPSGLLLAAVFMLNYLGENQTAERMHNAWLKTIEDGIHTYDIYQEGKSFQLVGTKEFSVAVAKNLGRYPEKLPRISYRENQKFSSLIQSSRAACSRSLVGVDVFIYDEKKAQEFVDRLQSCQTDHLQLVLISNRGVTIWPEGHVETACIEQWRCRFAHKKKGQTIDFKQVTDLLVRLDNQGYDVIKTENLYAIEGKNLVFF